MENKMAKLKSPGESTGENPNHDHIYAMANQISRSIVAVIDTLVQRGAFKGEELSTIGGLRDQALQTIQVVESYQADVAAQQDAA